MALGKDAGDKEDNRLKSDNSRKLNIDEEVGLESDIKHDAEDVAFESVWETDNTGDDGFVSARKPAVEDAGLESAIKLDAEDVGFESD